MEGRSNVHPSNSILSQKFQTMCNGDREKYYQKVQFYQQTMSKG